MAESWAGFGEELRTERERRGLALETLCAETKVNPKHFFALEQGDLSALPGGVFRRGIVRAYLGAVGLEERLWMPRFEESYAAQGVESSEKEEPAWAAFAENVKRNRATHAPRNTARWLGVLALFVALLAAGWALWHFMLEARLRG